jgi:hypothetical protein
MECSFEARIKEKIRQVPTAILSSTGSTTGDKAHFILQANQRLSTHKGYIYNGSKAR